VQDPKVIETDAAHKKAAAIFQKLRSDKTDGNRHRNSLMQVYFNQTWFYRTFNKLDEANAASLKRVEMIHEILSTTQDEAKLLWCHSMLGQSYLDEGDYLLFRKNQKQKAFASYQKSCFHLEQYFTSKKGPTGMRPSLVEALADDDANRKKTKAQSWERACLVRTHSNRSNLLEKEGQLLEAAEAQKRAAECDYPDSRSIHRTKRAELLARAGSHSQAMKEIENLKIEPSFSFLYRRGVKVAVIASKQAAEDPALSAEERKQIVERYLSGAVVLLRREEAAAKSIQREPLNNLEKEIVEALKGRSDFEQLRKELEDRHVNAVMDPKAVRNGLNELAIRQAEEMAKKQKDKADLAYRAACVCAAAIEGVKKTPWLAPTQAQQLTDRYATRAMVMLRQAESAGFFRQPANLTRLKADKNLEPLRERDDFKKWLTQLAMPK
jgi:hypothetical protein